MWVWEKRRGTCDKDAGRSALTADTSAWRNILSGCKNEVQFKVRAKTHVVTRTDRTPTQLVMLTLGHSHTASGRCEELGNTQEAKIKEFGSFWRKLSKVAYQKHSVTDNNQLSFYHLPESRKQEGFTPALQTILHFLVRNRDTLGPNTSNKQTNKNPVNHLYLALES